MPLDAAAVAARESYGRAREAGWTDSELEQLGYAERGRRVPAGATATRDEWQARRPGSAELTADADRNHPAGVGQ